MKTIASCADCRYPIGISNPGQKISCPMCGTENEAISGTISQLTSIPIISILGFIVGFIIGRMTK